MFYVNLYLNGKCFNTIPFEKKDLAIEYFNHRIDFNNKSFPLIDYIDITNDNSLVLFECEV